MECKNCGKENDEGNMFCYNCGNPLKEETIQKDNKKKNSKLSWIALGFLIWQIIAPLFSNIFIVKNTIINIIFEFPWILVSLILTIVSRCIYKDKLSKYLLIIELILIVIAVIFIIFYIFVFGLAVGNLFNLLTWFVRGCSEIG